MTTTNKLPFNCLHVERALLGIMSLDELNQNELEVYQTRKPGFEIGRLSHRMAQGYYAHTAAVEVAKDPRSKNLASTILQGIDGKPFPVGYVARKDGTAHTFDFHHYLDYLNNQEMVNDFAKTWLVGSLLVVGDALKKHNYLDRAPELELLYHLRNSIAHGNKFNLTQDGLVRLRKYPAHNKQAKVKNAEFEIVETLKGKPVLFDFMGPGDVLDLLMSVEIYLTRIC
jgi:hypothetical protein